MKIGAKVIKKLNTNKLNYKIMKTMTINHQVEIENNVLGFVYIVLQYTTFNNRLKNEHVKFQRYDLETGKLECEHIYSNESYVVSKNKMKQLVQELMPI